MKELTNYDKEDLYKALETLKNGGVILYPTDTVWGLGCDAENEKAVKKIYEIKKRSDSKSMLCLIDDMCRLYDYIEEVPDLAYDLNDMALRPITIIYDGAKNIAPSLIAEDGSIGIRVSKESFSKELCKRLGRPIVSTSANISGEQTPTFFREISKEVRESVDYIVRYRQNDEKKSSPSQIIRLKSNGEVKVIRE